MSAIFVPNYSPSHVMLPIRYRIDFTHPLAFGLYHINILNGIDPANPLFTNSKLDPTLFTYSGGAAFELGPAGIGIAGHSTSAPNTACVFYPDSIAPKRNIIFNILQGSIFAYVSYPTAVSGSAYEAFGQIGNSEGAGGIHCLRYTDNNMYFGWNNTSRVIVAFQADWPHNTTGIIGGTYCTSSGAGTPDTQFWYNGRLYAAKGAAAVAGTVAVQEQCNFAIGAGGTVYERSFLKNDSYARVYWVAAWDRVLSDSEIVYLNANPMCFLLPAEGEMPMLQSALAQWQLYFSKNSGAYEPVTTTSLGVKSADASTDADETKILIPRL